MTSKKKLTKEWQIKAENDIVTINILIKDPAAPHEVIAFHCQQAVEKYFKSFLFMKEITIPKTHDLDLLYSLCIKINPMFKLLDRQKIAELTEYAVDSRYPGSLYIPTAPELETFFNIVKQVKELIFKITK